MARSKTSFAWGCFYPMAHQLMGHRPAHPLKGEGEDRVLQNAVMAAPHDTGQEPPHPLVAHAAL
jgi:hypothetical protein